MGEHLNPSPVQFHMDRAMRTYVDKSMIIDFLNTVACTGDRYVCVSRPRRFGKTMAAEMISAYYNRTLKAEEDCINGLVQTLCQHV